jgi:3-phenylpropionate/trans-cinnamate dioxygenase ferredoxin reductase subunit
MGFIGCEVAASLRQHGVEVVCIDPSPTPLFRALGEQVGQVVAGIHRDHGVRLVLEDVVTAFEGTGRVDAVTTRRGRRFACDFAVVGVGVDPAVDVIAGSGVHADNGILVDEYCRTNVPDIYAAGDVANHHHPVHQRRMRVEHWQNAMQQGAAAARSMLGKGRPYDPVHWFWSDQYDLNLQYAGFHAGWDDVVVRGRLDDRSAIVCYLRGQRVDAAVAVNRGKDLRRIMTLIKARARVDPRQLGDESVDLRSLVEARLSGAQT